MKTLPNYSKITKLYNNVIKLMTILKNVGNCTIGLLISYRKVMR
jgi:hypothetical protein